MSSGELQRLIFGPDPSDRPIGIGIDQFVVRCRGNAAQVLALAQRALETVLRQSSNSWPSYEGWASLLPKEFVERFVPETTKEENERWLAQWRALPPEEQGEAERERGWSLADWVYWFRTDNRAWFWWEASVVDPNTVLVKVDVVGWPYAWGALKQLFEAAGAVKVEQKIS